MKTKFVILLILLLPSFGLIGGGLYAQHPELFNHSWFIQNAMGYNNSPSTLSEIRFEIFFEQDKIIVEGCCGGIFEVEVNYIGNDELEIISLTEIQTTPCQEGYVTSFYHAIKDFFDNMLGEITTYDIIAYNGMFGHQLYYFKLNFPSNNSYIHISNFPNDHVEDSHFPYMNINTTNEWSLTNIKYQGDEYELPYGAAFTVFDLYEGSFEIQLCGSVYGKMQFSWDWDSIGGPCFISCGELDTLDQTCEEIEGVSSTYLISAKQLIFDFLTNSMNEDLYWGIHYPNNNYAVLKMVSTDGGSVIFHNNENYLSLNTFEEKGITIYPNPTSGLINIDIPEAVGTTGIRLVDMHGKTLMQNQSENQDLDLSGFAAGVYFVEITTPQGKTIKKVVKK